MSDADMGVVKMQQGPARDEQDLALRIFQIVELFFAFSSDITTVHATDVIKLDLLRTFS